MKKVVWLILVVSFLYSRNCLGKEIIGIGTGSKNALAYPVVKTMCDTYNKYNVYDNLKCYAVETGGSKENLDGIISGAYDAGVVKSDIEYNAYNGIGGNGGKEIGLRNIFGLHEEYLTLAARKDSGIRNFRDFKGHKVYIGNNGSGSRIMVEKLLNYLGWDRSNFEYVDESESREIGKLFCEKKIDAAIYLVGHPNHIFQEALRKCDINLISFSRRELEEYVDIFRYVKLSKIRKETYKEINEDIETLSSQLMLVTSDRVNEKFIYNFVKIITSHFEEIKKKNKSLEGIDLFDPDVRVIPLHKGSERFLQD